MLVAVVWTQRGPIASSAIDEWFERRGVGASFTIDRLDASNIVLRDISLANGSLRARRIKVHMAGWPFAARPIAVEIDRPVLNVSVSSAGVGLGGLEALIPDDSDPDAPLPSLRLRIAEGLVRVATPAGPLTLTVEGDGALNSDFAAALLIAPAHLDAFGCTSARLTGRLKLTTRGRRVDLAGQGTTGSVACAGRLSARRGGWALDTRSEISGRTLGGSASIALIAPQSPGLAAAQIVASISGSGDPARISGRWRVGADRPRVAGLLDGDRLEAGGAFVARPADRAVNAELAVRGSGLRPDAAITPPALAEALRPRGGFLADINGSVALATGAAAGRIDALTLRSTSGARLVATGRPLLLAGPGGWRLTGTVAMGGGGLPRLRIAADRLTAQGGRATLALAPYAIAGGTVAADLAATHVPAGWRVAGEVRGAAAAAGWSVAPVVLRGAATVPASWDALRLDGCATVAGGGAARGGVRLSRFAGRVCAIARDPLRLTAAGLRGAAAVAPVRIGIESGGLHLAASVGGRIDAAPELAAAGTLARLSATGEPLPVGIAGGSGRWAWRDGVLALEGGAARLSDAAPEPRFEPLALRSFAVRVESGGLSATGELGLPKGVRLVTFAAHHDLATGTGDASFATGALTFGPALQPDEISAAFRGVVANVEGTVRGAGELRWTPGGLTSRGHAETEGLDLATAALGPVRGIAGRIEFDDLVAVTTPPGQRVTVASINPGVLVENGVFTFRMLGPTRVAIAGAEWPFVGGRLILHPTEIAADEPVRRFTLDVDGADAAQFLQRFDIPNLNVTGIFDGRLPLVFDGTAGRIEKGLLTARPPGGIIQYAGEVGADSMGAAGRLAFDALKRLRYRSLGLEFDGALDGEIVTAIRFAGTNEAPVAPAGGVPVRANGLPFKFNVTVRAPFRSLLGTAASFGDVRETIRAGVAADPPPEK